MKPRKPESHLYLHLSHFLPSPWWHLLQPFLTFPCSECTSVSSKLSCYGDYFVLIFKGYLYWICNTGLMVLFCFWIPVKIFVFLLPHDPHCFWWERVHCTAALYVVGSPLPLMVAFKIFSNLWFSSVLTMTYIHIYIYVRCGFLCNYSVWSSLNILNLYIQSITKLGNILAFTYSYFFCPTFFCSSEDTIIYTLNCLILPHMALNFCAFFSSLQSFFLYSSDRIISIHLSSIFCC